MLYDLKITHSDGRIECSTFKTLEELNAYDLSVYGAEFTTKVIPEQQIVDQAEQTINHPEVLDEQGNVVSEAYVQIIPATYMTIPEHTVVVTNWTKEVLENKSDILAEIEQLEAQITPRRIREALLSGDNSFIDSINQQILALRVQL